MGHLAVYIAIDDAPLDALWQLADDPFRARFFEIEEDESLDRLNLDKIWDVLHCTLTGNPASDPIEGNKLSESIVGVHPKIYDDEDYSVFVSVIDNQEIEGILDALEEWDSTKLKSALDPSKLRKQKVYPKGIWDDDPDRLVVEMDDALCSIRTFFGDSLENGKHVLATIL